MVPTFKRANHRPRTSKDTDYLVLWCTMMAPQPTIIIGVKTNQNKEKYATNVSFNGWGLEWEIVDPCLSLGGSHWKPKLVSPSVVVIYQLLLNLRVAVTIAQKLFKDKMPLYGLKIPKLRLASNLPTVYQMWTIRWCSVPPHQNMRKPSQICCMPVSVLSFLALTAAKISPQNLHRHLDPPWSKLIQVDPISVSLPCSK